jgi:hypothetical protein
MKTLQGLYMAEPSPENLKVIKGIIAKIDKAVIIEPTIKRWVEDLGDVWQKYTNKLVTYIVIQKEVSASIPALLNILSDDPEVAAAIKEDDYSRKGGVTEKIIDDYFQTIKDVVQTTPNKFKEYVNEGKYFKDKFKSHILELVDKTAALDPGKQAEFDKK